MLKAFYVAASVIAVASSAKPAAADQPFVFFNSDTHMCLQPLDQSTAQGVAIVQEPCTTPTPPTQAQEWVYVPNGSAAGFQFENGLSGLCLDARGGAEDGTPVQQWTCDQISNENWDPPTNPQGQSVGPVISGVAGSDSFCLDIPGGQQTAGLAMQIFRCNGTVSQAWELRPIFPFVPNVLNLPEIAAVSKVTLFDLTPVVTYYNACVSPGAVIAQSPEAGGQQAPTAPVNLTVDSGTNCPVSPVLFYNSHTDMCLQPLDGATFPGAAIVQEPCNGSIVAQAWSSIGLHFENALSHLCLDARGGADNHTPVQQWTCDQISNENWTTLPGPQGEGAPVISRVSGSDSFCLDIPGGQQTPGLAMQIFSCNGTVSQIWQLKPDSSLAVPKK